jgi:DNA-binding transcriptional ArsR family regulator
MANDSQTLDAVFLALSDPTRRAILERLARGEASGTELARPFPISVPAISKHLRVLEQAALISRRKEGRVHRFRLGPTSLRDASAWLDQCRQLWEAQFDSLESYLSVTADEETPTDDRPSS